MDTEDDSKGNVFCINFYDGSTHTTFMGCNVQQKAIEWLHTRSRDSVEIWAVNLAYDLNNLFKGHFTQLEIIYADTRVITARLLKTKIFFKDTLNHWKLSVKEMGKRIGLHKIETKDFKNVEYCRRDTEICYHFVKHMEKNYQTIGCELKATIGSTSLHYFYKNFWDRPKPDEILSQSEIEFLRGGYYGGRTEIFFTKPVSGFIWYFDVNSLYPSVMRDFHFPKLCDRLSVFDLIYEGMAEVDIYCSTISIPYLPYRINNKGIIFPQGKLHGTYTYFEIREALKLGYKVLKVYKAITFTKTCQPFKKFVDTLYDWRLKAQADKDELLSQAAKDISNNLYGKFAQKNVFTKLVPYNRFKDQGTIYGDMLLKKTTGKYPKHTNIIWACYTTAYARHRLYEYLVKVGLGNGLLIYCDTDSIIFENSSQIFTPSQNLGELKLEKGSPFRYAHFKLPKLYCLKPRFGKWTYKSKGVRRDRASEFFRTGRTRFKRPYKLRESLRRNLSPKKTYEIIPNYWEFTIKEARHRYDKRIVSRSGHTSPIVI